jgi:hypothetical protein
MMTGGGDTCPPFHSGTNDNDDVYQVWSYHFYGKTQNGGGELLVECSCIY